MPKPASAICHFQEFPSLWKFPSAWKIYEMSLPDPWRFSRREEASHYAHVLADAPRRPLAIFGPRQIGKTHFLTHDLWEEAQALGWQSVYADLWGQPDPMGAINTALATALRAIQTRTTRTPVTSVGALGLNVSMAAPPPLAQVAEPSALFSSQFGELRRLQPDRPVLLMLDEAQTLVRPGAGDAAMKAIRAVFNANPGAILLLLTGSSKAQLMSLVGDHSKTAFKLAAHTDFPLLGVGFVKFVVARIKTISGRELSQVDLDWAFTQLLHRPGEMIDFARYLVTEAPWASVRDALIEFKERNRPDASYQAQFDQCTPVQRAVLYAVAIQAKLFAKDTREQIARTLGQTDPVAPATVHNALAQLEGKSILTKQQGRGHYAFEDEQMRDWIREVTRGAVGTARGPS